MPGTRIVLSEIRGDYPMVSGVESDRKISFNDAWRDFLLIRDVPHKIPFVLYHTKERVVKIEVRTGPLTKRRIGDQWYFCYESPALDVPLCYPQEIVSAEIERKIIKPILGKRFEESKIDSIIKASKKLQRRITSRLGAQFKHTLRKLVSEEKYWEVLFSLHPILEHRLRRLLKYKSMHVDESGRKITVISTKEKICEKGIRTFKHLTKLTFLVGAIDEKTKTKILGFDADRDHIAHELLKREISSKELENLCLHGLELMDDLENWFAKMVTRPQFIEMGKFEIPGIPTRLS